eukprot:CAMPEP_0171707534 /NCGR_PEP_ID=MMETSP0991-20121206/14429_1 /TAXON_ID=483369 /ORGANISM="non described non described, Strain CCMP2098" /LENGTH=310 /DNA_ID=CAMNT_0012297447 /DNA_START=218 /DNA_END=1147 /DNA_ORIENTATION=-
MRQSGEPSAFVCITACLTVIALAGIVLDIYLSNLSHGTGGRTSWFGTNSRGGVQPEVAASPANEITASATAQASSHDLQASLSQQDTKAASLQEQNFDLPSFPFLPPLLPAPVHRVGAWGEGVDSALSHNEARNVPDTDPTNNGNAWEGHGAENQPHNENHDDKGGEGREAAFDLAEAPHSPTPAPTKYPECVRPGRRDLVEEQKSASSNSESRREVEREGTGATRTRQDKHHNARNRQKKLREGEEREVREEAETEETEGGKVVGGDGKQKQYLDAFGETEEQEEGRRYMALKLAGLPSSGLFSAEEVV